MDHFTGSAEIVQPRLYVLVGVPASGKTTWIKRQKWAQNCAYVSTDTYVYKFARRLNSSYDQVFDLVMPRCVRLMMRAVQRAQAQGLDVIWDQTSTTAASRRRKLNALPDYYPVAVVFDTPVPKQHKKRLSRRKNKSIPWAVVENMIQDLEQQPPMEAEGFREIWHAK